ncbi:hypothetical protein FUA23_14930 [Neolewinella aurantiaca]|uniref:Uncharacterized protein n=1 Tax=Neolewinella aurantiaca TaxID=2602767 RepID=A0A5C7FUE2_9BACT|nr:hypothetical protein [Neolewinella aurantiaca]TXF88427.1 hypothetical protein FUA23_14930 [Neolewinella aurantiaca]
MLTILLQSNELAEDAYWLAGAAVIILIAALYFRKILADRAKRKEILHDPRSHVVNDSNYNINREGIDGHRDQALNANEARQAVETLKETEEIPSREEFTELRKDMDKEAR